MSRDTLNFRFFIGASEKDSLAETLKQKHIIYYPHQRKIIFLYGKMYVLGVMSEHITDEIPKLYKQISVTGYSDKISEYLKQNTTNQELYNENEVMYSAVDADFYRKKMSNQITHN